jgi:hypothetical protein
LGARLEPPRAVSAPPGEQLTYREVKALSDKDCASLACRPEQEILVAKLLPND